MVSIRALHTWKMIWVFAGSAPRPFARIGVSSDAICAKKRDTQQIQIRQ